MPGLPRTMLIALTVVLSMPSAIQAQPPAIERAPSSPAPDPSGPAPAPPAATLSEPAGQEVPQPYAPPSGTPSPHHSPFDAPPPASYGLGAPQAMSPDQVFAMTRKSPGLAFLIEFLLPGGGSIYGDHLTGALITWGTVIGGMLVLFKSGEKVRDPNTGESETKMNGPMLAAGVIIMLGGRTYGLIDSIVSTRAYNENLRRQLGLSAHFSIEAIRAVNGDHVVAPSLRLQF